MARLKRLLTKYGKLGVATHIALSCLWFGGIYGAIYVGVDVDEWLGRINIQLDSGASHTVLADCVGAMLLIAKCFYW